MPDRIERIALWLVTSAIRNARSHGSGDVSRTVRRVVLALRAALPGADLRFAYNQGLKPFGALRLLRDMEVFAPTFTKQPLPRGQEAALAALAAALDTPILAEESVYGHADMLAAARGSWADAVPIELMKCGGIGPARAVDAIAAAACMPTYGGAPWEGGIALAAATHLLGTLPNTSLGCEFHMPGYALVDDACADALQASAGFVRVPDGPGLGIVVDEATLRAQAAGTA